MDWNEEYNNQKTEMNERAIVMEVVRGIPRYVVKYEKRVERKIREKSRL